ncbi:MAG: phosphoenolpyruvate kinase [Polyangiales bacterium]
MKTLLTAEALAPARALLDGADRDAARWSVLETGARVPVHTLYGGAHLFRADITRRVSEVALRAMDEHLWDAAQFAHAFDLSGLPNDLVRRVHDRVREKLLRQPVEDLRVDFEDGYGVRPDEEEDRHAVALGSELAHAMRLDTLPPWCGIRLRALVPETRARAFRTLDLVLSSLLESSQGALPERFLIALPKVQSPAHVAALARALDVLERGHGLRHGALRVELMIETSPALINARGEVSIGALLDACDGRCEAMHLGAYDLTASVGVAASSQSLGHPLCEFARLLMQTSLAGTGVRVVDGATTTLPVARHRATAGNTLTDDQRRENLLAMRDAWHKASDDVRRALAHGIHQGWDLHPTQLVSRSATLYVHFLGGLDESARRLRAFISQAAQARRCGNVFDDAATAQAILGFFLRGIDCGALREAEVAAAVGAPIEVLRTRSFPRIVGALAD